LLILVRQSLRRKPHIIILLFGEENESIPTDKKKIIILGSGPNRIGQGIEFDYSCVHGVFSSKGMWL